MGQRKEFIIAAKETNDGSDKFTFFKDISQFASYVNSFEYNQQKIMLQMYSLETEQIKEVGVTPNSDWGGQGMLGADVVQGYLHTIPARTKYQWSEDELKFQQQYKEPQKDQISDTV